MGFLPNIRKDGAVNVPKYANEHTLWPKQYYG
jgi:hypothetical protein